PTLHSLFNNTTLPQIYTLSLHDALPIYGRADHGRHEQPRAVPAGPAAKHDAGHRPGPGRELVVERGRRRADLQAAPWRQMARRQDRKSTRLNSSHVKISYAVFCLKKKKK